MFQKKINETLLIDGNLIILNINKNGKIISCSNAWELFSGYKIGDEQLEEILLNLFILMSIILLNIMILFCGLEKIRTQSNTSKIKMVPIIM